MAILFIPAMDEKMTNPVQIRDFMKDRGIFFDQWACNVQFQDSDSQEKILDAYSDHLKPFMAQGGYLTADVISIHAATENYEAIRAKFLAEHIHTEDEIRFFVDGQGDFWFHLENDEIFCLTCQRGDLISVPAGTKHWFDAGEKSPFVKAIRIFIDLSGWVPHYTNSGIEKEYLS